jgi:cell wall-associated NlpC family hydrolase
MRRRLAVLSLAALLAGCATAPVERPVGVPPPRVAAADDLGTRAAALAVEQIGAPYRYGGRSPEGFDCSGLVWYVYGTLGFNVPRTAAEQRALATHVDREALEPGDLVFFATPADHVGIYLGGGEFVHAPSSGKHVERVRLDSPYFLLGYAGGGRFPRP